MTAAPAQRHPRSPWLVGCKEIAAYSGDGVEKVRAALSSGALVGWRQGDAGQWKTKAEHIDAWIQSGQRSDEGAPLNAERSAAATADRSGS